MRFLAIYLVAAFYLLSAIAAYGLALGTMTRTWPEERHLLHAILAGASGWTGLVAMLWIDHARSFRLVPLNREQRLAARSLKHLCGIGTVAATVGRGGR